jgi:hypothetical protein
MSRDDGGEYARSAAPQYGWNKQIARELGVDRNTVRRWARLGCWQPRQRRRRARALERFAPFIEGRAPEHDPASQQGLHLHPVGEAKSVVLTDEGLRESERLFRKLFAKL